MSWKDDKNLGPWRFSEQPDRWGYLNNPRWTKDLKAVAFASKVGLSAGPTAKHIPCGHWHKHKEIAPVSPGNLYGTGTNEDGRLGIDNSKAGSAVMELVEADKTFTSVSIGKYHSLAIASDGTLWATGRNDEGQLGLGDNVSRWKWEQVGTDSDWSYISCGRGYASYAIKSSGTLWSCGANSWYEAGFGDGVNRNTFTQLGSDSDWVAVDGGYSHMVALRSNGDLYGSGWNGEGELGQGDATDEIVGLSSLGVSSVVSISCGEYETMIIKTDGTLYGTGYNWSGMLGVGDLDERYIFTQIGSDTDWEVIACGWFHSLAIKSGALYAAGYNIYGELGFESAGSTVENFTQVGSLTNWVNVFAGYSCSGYLNSEDVFYMSGNSGYGEFGIDTYYMAYKELLVVATDVSQIAIGLASTLFIKSDGSLYVSGRNRYGEIGSGPIYHDTFELVNDETWRLAIVRDAWSILIKESDQSVWVSGYNGSGQLGLGDFPNKGYLRWRHVQVPIGTGWELAATGYNHSVLLKAGEIYGAGSKSPGCLALGASSGYFYEFTKISDETDWVFIACGSAWTFAINESGEMYATGRNSGTAAGALGLGDSTNRYYFTLCPGTGWKQASGGS